MNSPRSEPTRKVSSSQEPSANVDNRKSVEQDFYALKQEVGFIGKFVGRGKEKPGNIAGASIAASFLVILVIIVVPVNENESKHRFILTQSSIITLALGYLFGKR